MPSPTPSFSPLVLRNTCGVTRSSGSGYTGAGRPAPKAIPTFTEPGSMVRRRCCWCARCFTTRPSMSWMGRSGDGRSLAARGAALLDGLLLLGRDQAARLFLDLLMNFLNFFGLLLLG